MLQPNSAIEISLEKVRSLGRKIKAARAISERARLVEGLKRKPELANVMDKRRGFGKLPSASIPGISNAIEFAHKVRAERRTPHHKKADYNPTIVDGIRYEDAPAFYDLAMSDEILQVASDYLGEIPVLVSMKLWCTPPVAGDLKGSQYFHRDGRQWLLRFAKFVINMDDVTADTGPFTFVPADVSDRVSRSIGTVKQSRVKDDRFFQVASPSDPIPLIGTAGTGYAVDSARCFHYGGRVERGERLMLQFNFRRLSDVLEGGRLLRTPAFDERFGHDPIRQAAVPNTVQNTSSDVDD